MVRKMDKGSWLSSRRYSVPDGSVEVLWTALYKEERLGADTNFVKCDAFKLDLFEFILLVNIRTISTDGQLHIDAS